MKKSYRILYFITIICIGFSCKKLDLVPTNEYTELNYWTSVDKANLVLNTAYSQIVNPDYFFYNEVLSDNAYDGRGDAAGVTSISSGVYDPSLQRLDDEWRFHYQGIKTSNVILEYIDKVPGITKDEINQISAQARFLRAWHYFQLTTWWGAVPLFDHDISIEESQNISRSSHDSVVNFVLKELDDIENVLPVNTAYTKSDIGRITKGAVIALKARVYLYENRWQDVVNECSKLIGSTQNGTYSLFSSYAGLFNPANENNSEVILSAGYVPNLRTYGDLIDMVPISAGARLNGLAPTQELVNDYMMLNGKLPSDASSGFNANNPYTNRDPRMTATLVYDGYQWTKPDGSTKTIYIKPGTDPDKSAPDEYKAGSIASPTGYYVRKYYDPTASNFNSGLDLILIRYADVLLMYAEAKNELSKLDETDWNTTIKALRSRAGFTDANALDYNAAWSQSDLRTIIRRERRDELALEGLRIFDIRRWKTAETVLNGYVHGAQFGDPSVDDGYLRVNIRKFDPSRHYLWPIPRDERALNPNLDQNPGW
ncbi:hypothetical protein A9P82_12700 [Arachidicoccus ginsenosidimutans]|uniref:RagB/SusD family nutrient uptake outer membrane protein n=1 Tax=Arachidicoccus sp. BS20 TaxID=1850526 RepID=UPI0007F0F6AE|nr:RagB/SusD family nutrient uptake outer membrane protein [Arachidicoccus sp. BS20]ANI90067.1 hypothetical protein A9P82_12700 [Arachidicoccus sp. BS20]